MENSSTTKKFNKFSSRKIKFHSRFIDCISSDLIKQAFEYIEIHCTSDIDNAIGQHPRERLRIFLENICQTIENEQQLEIQHSNNEWNHQQKWLINPVKFRKKKESNLLLKYSYIICPKRPKKISKYSLMLNVSIVKVKMNE